MRNFANTLDHRSETFTLNLGLKDVELALQAGKATGAPMPQAALLQEQHRAAIKVGYGAWE